jgi:uncharacterized membrane protein
MANAIHTARLFYALASIVWGIQHFFLGVAVAGRPLILPESAAGNVFAYSTGMLMVLSGLAIVSHFKPRIFVAINGFAILLCAGLPNLYMVIVNLDYGFMLTSMNKALTFGFGGLLVAYSYGINSAHLMERLVRVIAPKTIYVIGFFLFISGIQHFLFVDFVTFLIPSWMPAKIFLTYFAGAALAAGGLGMINGIKRKLACELSGAMIFIWLFVLHLPRAIGMDGNANEWTSAFEALAISGLLILCSEVLAIKTIRSKISLSA